MFGYSTAGLSAAGVEGRLRKPAVLCPLAGDMSGWFAERESERILKRFGLAFGVVFLGYVLLYSGDRYLRLRKGPWELQFSSESDGTPRLVINQPALGITNVTLRLEGESVRQEPVLVRFDAPDQWKSQLVEIPYGRVLFFYRNYLPGTVILDLFGHEVEIVSRALILNLNEHEWQSGAVISLKPEQKWRVAAAARQEEELP